MYSNEEHAKIGRYVLENGSDQAQQNFLLKWQITVKNFKSSRQLTRKDYRSNLKIESPTSYYLVSHPNPEGGLQYF